MKEKELLKKLINRKSIITIIIVTIIAVLSGISVVQYNSHNVRTKLGEAQTTNYPFTGEQLIKAGAELSKGNVGYDCSGFVRQVILNCGASSVSATSTGPWHNGTATFVKNGVTYGLTTVQGITTKPQASSWFSVLNMNNLKPGDLVAGTGHIFIYVGYFSGNDGGIGSLKTYLKSLGIDANKVKIENRTSLRSNYWFIEGNVGTSKLTTDSTGKTIPVFRNYTWEYGNTGEGYSNNMDKIAVYRITTSEKNVKLKLVKKDMNNNTILNSKAQFTYWDIGTNDDGRSSPSGNPTGTTESEGTISLDNIKYGGSRYIWIKETKAPEGYAIGLKNAIKLKITVDQDGIITISKIHNGEGQNDIIGNYFYGFYKDGNHFTTKDTDSLKDCGENVSVRIKDPQIGNYHINLGKKSSENLDGTIESNLVAGVTYKVDMNNDDGKKTVKPVTKTTKNNITGTVNIKSLNNDTYVFNETDATSAGYVKNSKAYGVVVRKEVDSSGTYKIKNLKYYSGVDSTYKSCEINPGETWWIKSDGTPTKTPTSDEKKSAVACINLSSDKGAFAYIGINPPLEGEYNLKLLKVDDSTNWKAHTNQAEGGIGKATFKVKQYRNIKDFSVKSSDMSLSDYLESRISGMPVEKEVETVSNSWKDVYSEAVKINKIDDWVDIYKINETVAPDGYEVNSNTMYLKVTKEVQNEKYVIKNVDLLNTFDGSVLTNSDACKIETYNGSSEPWYVITHSNWNFRIIYNTAEIYVKFADTAINSYNVKLVKKSTNDSFSGNTTLGGAEFQVKQYKNNAETKIDPSKSDSQCNHITNPASDSIVKFIKNDYNDGNGNVLMYKNEAGKIDKYLIRETKSPQYYNKSKFFSENENNYILIEAVKAESGNKVIIDHINVYAYRYTQSGYVKEKITNFENAIGKGSSAQSEGDYNIYVGLNSAGTEIIVYEKNSPVPGNYDLNIGKKSTENYKNNNDSDYLSGVQYSVNLYANKTGDIIEKAKSNNVKIDSYLENYYKNNKKDYTIDIKTAGKAVSATNGEKINKSPSLLFDYFVIKETNTPPNFSKDPNTYIVFVERNIVGTDGNKQIKIKNVKIYNTDGTLITTTDGTYNGQTTKDSATFRVYYNADTITFVHADSPIIDGTYSLDILKRSMEDNSNDLSKIMSGVGFNVKQYKNQSTSAVNGYSSGKSNVVIEANKKTDIYFGDTNKVKIDDVLKYDEYTFSETSAPTGYEKSKLNLKLRVYKKRDGFNYKISRVAVVTATGSEVSTSNGIITISEDNKQVSNNVTEYAAKITVSDSSIGICWKDYRVGQYQLRAKKVDQYGNAMKGAQFKLTKGTDTTTNLFGNSGIVSSIGSNMGYTTIYTQSITKENINVTDEYTLTETTAPSGYSKLRDAIKIKVFKNSNTYKLEKIAVYVNGNNTTGTECAINSSTTINNVVLSNGLYVKVNVSVNSYGLITLSVENIEINGLYSLRIYKTVNKKPTAGITFNVTGNTSMNSNNIPSTSSGYTRTLSTAITKNNLNDEDSIIITENTPSDTSILKLKNPINLMIKKGTNTKGDAYIPKQIKAWENGKTPPGYTTINENGTTTLTVSNDVVISIEKNSSNSNEFVITIKVENPTIPPKDYKLQIKKINSTNNSAILDRKFKVYKINSDGTRTDLTSSGPITSNGSGGIATIDKSFKLENNTTDQYAIQEYYDNNYNNEYLKITNYEWILKINKTGNSLGTYKLGTPTISHQLISGKTADSEQEEIAKKATVSKTGTDTATVTITIPNTKTTNFSFVVNKVDVDGNTVHGSNFTITRFARDENHGTESISGNPNGQKITTNNTLPGETYIFSVTENSAPTGYKKIFISDTTSGSGMGYLGISVNVLSNGNIEVGEINWHNEDAAIIEKYLKKTGKSSVVEVVNKGNEHKVVINIPNEKETVPFSVSLNKHAYGSFSKKLGGITFNVRKAVSNSDVKEISSAIRLLNNNGENLQGFVTTETADSLINKIDEANINTSYLYEITETPDSRYNCTIVSAIVKIYVDSNKKVNISILAVKLNGSDGWIAYNSTTHGTKLSITGNGGNSFTIRWANEYKYSLKLIKKSLNNLPKDTNGNIDWSKVTATGDISARFLVKQTKPTEKTLVNSETFRERAINIDDVKIAEKYEYEIVEEATSTGYSNIFKGRTIKLEVEMDSEQNISTTLKVDGTDQAYLLKYIKVEIKDGTIYIYIVNPIDAYNVQVVKTTSGGEGIEGVTFNVFGRDSSSATFLPQKTIETDSSGTAFVTDKITSGKSYTVEFTEESVPDGVTKLKNTTIMLTIDAKNVNDSSPLTINNVSVKAVMMGAGGTNTIKGLSVNVIDKTIIVTIPNEVNYSAFSLEKKDIENNHIGYDKDNGGNIISGVNLDISLSGPGVTNSTVYSGYMSGTCSDIGGDVNNKRKLIGNSEYVYTITERNTKNGFKNIYRRWAIKLHIKTDPSGIIKPINATMGSQSNGNSYYEIVDPNGVETPPYELKNYVKFGLDTTDSKNQKITVQLINPPEYYIELNKKDSNGKTGVVAVINAYNRAVDATKPICQLQNETTGSGIPVIIKSSGQIDTWEIVEEAAADPYINIFKDKKIYVKTKYENSKLSVLSYNVDGDENSELKKYIEVTTEKEDMWKLIVTIKDPMKMKVRLNKVGSDGKPLSGAQLSIEDEETKQKQVIYAGSSSTEYMEREIGIGDIITYSIKEYQAAPGHVNVLGNKTLKLIFKVNDKDNIKCIQKMVIDSNNNQVTGSELSNILKYVKISSGKDGRAKTIDVSITNPLEYKFKLLKVDSAGNPLNGTQISVESSLSGMHYIDGKTSLEFMEDKVKENTTIEYTISELYTKGANGSTDTPYVNILGNSKIKLKAQLSNSGKLSIIKSCVLKENENGQQTEVPLSDFGVTLKPITTDENGIQSIEIVIGNSTSFNVEINKVVAGDDNTPISNTKFTIISSASGSHTEQTGVNGTISLNETNIKAGDYTIKVYEDKVASTKFINVLEDNYVEINVSISADGDVNFKDKNKPYKICSSNGTEITDINQLSFFKKYISVEIDKSSGINKIAVKIENPMTIQFKIKKKVAYSGDSDVLEGAKFSITSTASNKTSILTTDKDGFCNIEEKYIEPGVYKYEITEIESASKIYNNILDGYKIIAYIKLNSAGGITFVADENGTPLISEPLMQRYYVYKGNTSIGSTAEGQKIKNLIQLGQQYGDIPTAILTVGNTIEYKVDLVKLDSESKAINRVNFEVKRDGNTIFNKMVSDDPNDIEITESNMTPGTYTYYITETDVNNLLGVYVNVFKNKAIKVYTKLSADGTLTVVNDDSGNKFAIYSIDGNGNYTSLDRSDEAYKYVKDITVYKNGDGVSVLKVEVKDPTKYKVKIFKYNAEKLSTKGSKFTVIQQDSTGKISTLLNNDYLRDVEINPAEAGNYIYYITENSTPTNNNSKPGAQYVNVLKGKYMKVYVHLDANGRLTITNSNFVSSEKYYELYEGDITTRNGKKINNDSCISVSVDSRGTASTEKTLVINVVNPVTYNLDIVKQDTTGESLANSKFKVRRQVISTNSNDKIFDDAVNDKVEVTENRMLAGNYIYYIKETSSPATKYCNILEDGYLKLYVKVYGDGKVTLTNSKFEDSTSYYEWRKGNIDDPKDTDTLVATSGPMGRFVKAYVQESNSIYTIRVEVKNPLKLEFGIHKVVASSENNIPNVKFNITNSISGNTKTVVTDKDGLASVSEEDVSAGIYKFEITEIETASEIYNNLLEGYKIVVYLKITGDGTITYVSDENGTEFGNTVAADKHFHVYKDNTNVDATKEGKAIISLVSLKTQDGAIPKTVLKVGNTLNYKMNLTKKDTANNTLTGSIFVVKRFDNEIFNGGVTDDTEITEKNMLPGTYDYYITESSISNKNGTYVNVFKDKAIKLFLSLDNKGNITIIEKGGKKFEICSVSNGKYTVLNDDIAYQFVKNIEITKDSNGVNIIQVEVENPTNYNFNVIKKDAAENNVKGSKFTAYREDSNGNIKQVLNNEELKIINETPMRAGNYIYYITENSTPTNNNSKPGAQYVNVLKGKYMKVYVHLDANGRLTITNSNFVSSEKYYELYEGDITTRNGKKINNDSCISVSVDSRGTASTEKTLVINVVNPVTYNLDIVKQDTTGESLANSKFKVRRQVISTNSNDKIFDDAVNDKVEVTENRMLAGNYIYYIKETSSPATKYCNILEDGYLKLYVKVYGDGKVTLTNSKFEDSTSYYEWRKGNIDDPKDTDTLVATSGPMGRFVKAYVQESNSIYTIRVEVKNPLKLEFGIHKVVASSENNIPNVKFNITNSISGNTKTVVTDKDGLASVSEEDVSAGIYKFEITEIETASEIYNNLLEGYKIVVYLKITGDGTITYVSDENGTEFGNTVAADKHFHVYKDNTNVDATKEGKAIISLVSLKTQDGAIPKTVLKVGNTLNYKMNLTKKDTANNTLTGSIFVVKRFDNEIFNGGVTDDTEITEKNMLPGTYDYYITESSISNKNGTYVNVFKDKAIKLFLSLDNKGNITIIEKGGKKFEICSVSNGKYTVLNDDIAYQFVKNIEITKDSNGVNIIQVEVENPTNYNFNVIKKDAAENNVKGSKFTAYREDSNGNIKQVLNNEELKIINETPMRAGNYIYYITETATPGKQYVNVLEGKYMKVYVHLDANGRLSITNSKFQVADNYYEIYKGDISKRDGTKVENSEFISVNVSGPQNNVYTLNVVVTNPVKINTNIIKKDTSNNDLASSHFKVRRQDVSTKTFSDRFEGEVTSGIEKTESPMRAGNYIYYVTEKSSPNARYTNILEKTYLKIYVKISGDGKVVITDSKFNESAGYYEWYNGDINNPKDSDTKIDKSDPRNQYIKDISTSVEDSIYTVNVTVVNPVKIRVNVNKKIFGDDEVNLQNVEIKAETPDGFTGVVTKVTDKDGNISFIDQYANAGLRRYLVTEAKPAGEEFVNVLEHKEILVYTIVKADGTFQIVDEDGVPTENKWYAYNNTDSNNKVKLNENTDVIKNFVKVSQSVGKDGISELNFAIKNPQKYKLHLRKIDKDNKKGMNGVTFDLSVSDGKNIVKLRNANTLENMNTEGLVTSTVDGADGVIEINDILIEKSGTYTYTLHEHSTDGIFDWLYKNHKDDIILRIKIVVRDGKYVIENLETVQGGDYVGDLSIATGIGSTIKNERIKGKYDLILNKVDSYTEKALDGAVFNIHVEKDGKEHTLYKSTEDVDSMEQILPVDNVVVKDGKLEIKDIRIEEIGRDRLEEYTIVLTEVTAPKGYMLLDAPIKLKVTTNTTGKFDDEKYIVESVELVDDENHGLVTFDYNENKIVVTAKNEYFDLALRKSITSVAYPDTNEGEITEEETKDRIPEVITDGINEGPNGEDPTETTAVYNHKKNPVRAYKEQEVIYTLRVYNEGEIDGYAEEITDHLPEWLEFVDDDFNKERGWSLDENDETGRTVRTKNLSKAYADENGVDNLIKAKNKVTGDLDSKEIQIKCRVSEKAKLKTVLTNIAEISLSKADDRTSETVDRDSVTNNVKIPGTSEEMSKYKDDELNKTYVPGQEDDDDFEKVIVEAFDLSLRKYITAVNDEQMLKDNTDTEDKKQNTQDKNNESTKDENSENTEDKNKVTNDESTNNETTKDEGQEKTDDSQEGNNNDEEQKDTVDDNSADLKYAREPLINIKDLRDKPDDVTTATYTHTKEPVEVSVDDIVTYTISVYNEGTVSGYASLIKDDIPEGLEYVKDSEINKKFNWKLLDENNKETDDVKKAKYIVSDYLSKENGDDNILNAFNGEKLDTKYVQVDFKVICKQDWAKIIKNEAQISDDQDDRGKPVRDRDSTPNEWKGEDDEDVEYIRVTYMDLALRKFITGVNKQIITDRIPEVDATALKNKENTTADYKHTKEPVIVHTNDTVIYTIRVYNEGSKDGYATQIKDDIPEGLEFIPYNETNKMYEWKMLDAEGKETLDVSKVKSVVTNYCSKDKETEKRQNLMLAFERPDGTTFDTPEYKDVKIAFKVVEPTTSDRILINHAQISEQTDKKGIHREDRDSTPNEWKGEDDEDIEKVRVLYFDLALRKWVTNTMVTENGQTFVTETGHHAEDDPEEVVKVDLKKSKINSVVVKFEYKVRITNEGEIAGYAKEIKDRIPDGLEFEEADNPNWKMLEDGTVVTDELKDKLLQPGESAEVIIVLKWINSPTNLGVKINFAEISKDHNDYGTPDIDSTPNNNVPGEDDIDDAPVMLTVKTGSQDLKYMLAILVVLTALVGSVSLLKKNLQKNKYN